MNWKKVTVDKDFSEGQIQQAEIQGFYFYGNFPGRTFFITELSNKAIRKVFGERLTAINNNNTREV